MAGRRWALVLVVLTTCGGTVEAPAPECAEEQKVAGRCAGLVSQSECRDQAWTDGVACSEVLIAADAGALSAALAQAAPGTCIDLGAGTYGAVELPSGVSLLGRGHSCTSVAGLSASQGGASTVRGISVQEGGVQLRGPTEAHIEHVRIISATQDGIAVTEGASLSLVRSEVVEAGQHGIRGFGAARLSVEGSVVLDSAGPGIWAECMPDSCVGTLLPVMLDAVRVKGNTVIGVSLAGADATLLAVEITETKVGPTFDTGGGLSATLGTRLAASELAIRNNQDYGMHLEGAEASLSGMEIHGNLRGLSIHNRQGGQSVEISNAALQDNMAQSIVIHDGSPRVVVRDTTIATTTALELPVLIGGVSAGAQMVGEGVMWCMGAGADLDGLTIEGSARVSILINGPVGAGSRIANIVLRGGDEGLGVVHQNVPPGGAQPEIGPGVPYQATAEELFGVSCR